MTANLFNFDDEFKLGIPEIDAEHAALINMLNEVMNLNRKNEKDKARLYFQETLSRYVVDHFAHEEAYMQKIGYPQLDEHRKVHENFKQAMFRYMEQFNPEDHAAFRGALMDAYSWIINHIGKTDRKYVGFAQ